MGHDLPQGSTQVGLDGLTVDRRHPLVDADEAELPVHQAQARIRFAWQNLSLKYTHLYTGKTTGINANPPAFQLGNVHLQYLRKRKSGSYLIFFQINNLWDLDYQVIERRPMPGIHYQMGINFTLNKNQQK